jgi:hypothetical protein
MLATRAAEWKQQWRQEGRQEGRREGETALLLRLMERRFGVLSAAVRDRVAAADLATVEEWGLRVLDASSIDDVLT